MTDDTEHLEPKARFGGLWVPTHKIWEKLETATAVTDVIDRFNQNYPQLSTDTTRKVVPQVRDRLKSVEVRLPKRPDKTAELVHLATELLQTQAPEDVLDALAREHNCDCDLQGLIYLAGEQSYEDSLQREAKEFETNRILPEQTATLWNDAKRPVPGGGRWTAAKVRQLLS